MFVPHLRFSYLPTFFSHKRKLELERLTAYRNISFPVIIYCKLIKSSANFDQISFSNISQFCKFINNFVYIISTNYPYNNISRTSNKFRKYGCKSSSITINLYILSFVINIHYFLTCYLLIIRQYALRHHYGSELSSIYHQI